MEPIYSTPLPEPQPRRLAQNRDLVFAVLCAVLSIWAVDCALWHGSNLGLGIALAALCAISAGYLWPVRQRLSLGCLVCFAGTFLCAAALPWSSDAPLKLFSVLAAILLNTLCLLEGMQQWHWGSDTFRVAADACRLAFYDSCAGMPAALWALFHRQTPDGVRSRRTGSILLGLLCAIPLLVILVPLLVLSDAAFEGLLRQLDAVSIGKAVASLLFGLLLALGLFAQWFRLSAAPAKTPTQPPADKRGLEPAALGAFLTVISALYLLYLFSQLAYVFSGFSGILPEGFTPAEYARRGFFEMCAVCAINLVLCALSLILSRRSGGQQPLVIRLLALFLCLFSLALIAAAVAKMALYLQSYGLTRLRVLTLAFMLFLAITFLCVIIRLFWRRFGYMRVVLLGAVLLLLGLQAMNIDRTIATYNYQRWQDGTLQEMDVSTIGQLSDAAVPTLWELANSDNPELASEACRYLVLRGQQILTFDESGTPVSTSLDLRAYNRDTSRAREILLQHWTQIYATYERGYWGDQETYLP